MKQNILLLIVISFSIGADAAHKGSRAATQTLRTEGYLNRCIPVSLNFQSFMDENSGMCNKVVISFEDSKEQVIITTLEDYSSKDSKNGAKKMVFREPPERAYLISGFEAEQIGKVCKTFTQVLEAFDQSLEKRKWDKCQGLDSYLLRFLKGFNFLICSASNNTVKLISEKYCPDSVYSTSVDLNKLNGRINHWRMDAQSRSKLQTVTKELLFQCRIWQRDLVMKKRNQDVMVNEGFVRAMEIFVKIYLQ